MNRDVFSHSHDERDLCLDSLFNGLCSLISRDINCRGIRFGLLLRLKRTQWH